MGFAYREEVRKEEPLWGCQGPETWGGDEQGALAPQERPYRTAVPRVAAGGRPWGTFGNAEWGLLVEESVVAT